MKDIRRSTGTPLSSVLSPKEIDKLKRNVLQMKAEKAGNSFRCTKKTCKGCRDSVCNKWQ